MISAAIRMDQADSALIRVLDRNGIRYVRDGQSCIRCDIRGRVRDIALYFLIDPHKMLVTLYAPLPFRVLSDQVTELSTAVCLVNNRLSDGMFGYDASDGMLYFKMTQSFYNSSAGDCVFEYLLSVAAETIDEYIPRLSLAVWGRLLPS